MTGPELRWGYTLNDLQQITVAALRADRSLAMDYADRRDVAWSAIAEQLYAADEPPSRPELVRVGWQAIYAEVRSSYRHHGYAHRDRYAGHASSPRFAAYWTGMVTPSHEEGTVERLALPQVLSALTGVYRDAVLALAATGDYAAAAAALDISYKALVARLVVARRTVIGLWLQPETPHRPRRTDRRIGVRDAAPAAACARGHRWTPENTRIERSMVAGRVRIVRRCRACERVRPRRSAARQVAA